MSFLTNCCHLALLISCAGALIIPEELPSILSVIYSNIPPIKKGTDSRVGVGFRLGEHADFQVLLELGPQTNTQPLGPNADSKRRRQVQRPALIVQPARTSSERVANTPGGKWLSSWRSGFVNPKLSKHTLPPEQQFMLNPMEGKEHIASHLQQLYKKPEEVVSSRSNDNNDAQIVETRTLGTENVSTETTTVKIAETTASSASPETVTAQIIS